jgi:hypothetical protein
MQRTGARRRRRERYIDRDGELRFHGALCQALGLHRELSFETLDGRIDRLAGRRPLARRKRADTAPDRRDLAAAAKVSDPSGLERGFVGRFVERSA